MAAVEAAGDEAPDADRDAAAALAEDARRQAELARSYGRYQALLAANGSIDFGDQVSLALRLLRESPAAREVGPAAVQVHPRRRVPGHEPRPGGARRAGRRAAPQRDGGRRRRPVDLQVPRRGDQQHPRVPRALPAGAGRRPAPELPLARADPRRVLPPRPAQRPGPAGGARGHRQAARPAAGRRRRAAGPPRGVRERPPRRRTGSPPTSRAGSATAGTRATSPSWCAPTRRRTRCLRSLNLEGIPWRFSGTSGLYARPEVRLLLAFLRAIADPSSSVDVYALAASDLYAPRGHGPGRDREHRPPPEPIGLGGPRGARAPAGDPAALPGDPRRGVAAGRGPAAIRRARQRATGGRGPVRVPAGDGLARAGSRRGRRSPRRRRCRTSPASSTSSGPSRRSSPTTGRCSSRATSTR